MSVPFPTRPGYRANRGVHTGLPQQARTCRCDNAWLEQDHCVKCGYFVERAVRQTFYDQARRTRERHPSPVKVRGPQSALPRKKNRYGMGVAS